MLLDQSKTLRRSSWHAEQFRDRLQWQLCGHVDDEVASALGERRRRDPLGPGRQGGTQVTDRPGAKPRETMLRSLVLGSATIASGIVRYNVF
jgi:hypothetical protein